NQNNIPFLALNISFFMFFHVMPCDDGNLEFYRNLYNTLGPETVLKIAIFNELAADHPTAWRTGLSINDMAAFHCVDKEWNKICKGYVKEPRQEIVEKYKNHFTIIPSTLSFNKYDDWCCITTKNELLVGNINEQIPHSMAAIRPTKELHIQSLD